MKEDYIELSICVNGTPYSHRILFGSIITTIMSLELPKSSLEEILTIVTTDISNKLSSIVINREVKKETNEWT